MRIATTARPNVTRPLGATAFVARTPASIA